MVGALPEAAAEEQISSPEKRPRLRMLDKRKENSKEARNKQFRVEERPRRGHRPHLKTYIRTLYPRQTPNIYSNQLQLYNNLL